MGCGFKQILEESPLYFHLGLKYAGYKLFNKHSPIYGSADIPNVCNLHRKHCYWWLNKKEDEDLTLEQWGEVKDAFFALSLDERVKMIMPFMTMKMQLESLSDEEKEAKKLEMKSMMEELLPLSVEEKTEKLREYVNSL